MAVNVRLPPVADLRRSSTAVPAEWPHSGNRRALSIGCLERGGENAALVPLAHQRPLYQGNGLTFWGVGLMALGVAALGWAGLLRERASSPNGGGGRSIAYGPGLVWAIACGLLSPMLNYAFAFSDQIPSAALQRDAPPEFAGYAVWPVVLTAGFLPNVVYSLYCFTRIIPASSSNARTRMPFWQLSWASYGWGR